MNDEKDIIIILKYFFFYFGFYIIITFQRPKHNDKNSKQKLFSQVFFISTNIVLIK